MPKCTALLLSCGLVVVSSDPNTHFICISHIICKSHTHIICVVPALVIQASTASGRRVIFSAPNFRDAHRWKAGEKLALPKRVCLQTRTDTPFSAASLYLRIHLLQTVSCPADLTHPLKPNLPPPAAAAAAAAARERTRFHRRSLPHQRRTDATTHQGSPMAAFTRRALAPFQR